MPDEANGHRDAHAPRVVVIGGGATGCAVARDLALRGFAVTLVEFGDLASGTSSRFHGMLQSGARYVVSDTGYAAECMGERDIVARLIPEVVEPRGGLFLSLGDDPPEFATRFKTDCAKAGIPCEELDPDAVLREEPHICRDLRRAFAVPDATINPWLLTNALAEDVRRRGGRILTRARVTAIAYASSGAAKIRVARAGGEEILEADLVVNAAGAWSARIAALVGQEVGLQLTKGSIIVLAHRMTRRIVNRCRPPTSHDIMVPTGTVSLFGTTSRVVEDPDVTNVDPEEIQELLKGAEPLIPGIRDYRALRAWAGVRPLVKPADWPEGAPLPRRHKVIDHGKEGRQGFFTVCGGSLTTHRSMAEDLGNRLCRSLGLDRPCRTATTALLGRHANGFWRPAARYEVSERIAAPAAPAVCECEQLSLESLTRLLEDDQVRDLHDIRRRARLGFGPCQGTFCANRAAGLLAEVRPGGPGLKDLEDFWRERLKGMTPTAWNAQARQALLSDLVHRDLLGLRPADTSALSEVRR